MWQRGSFAILTRSPACHGTSGLPWMSACEMLFGDGPAGAYLSASQRGAYFCDCDILLGRLNFVLLGRSSGVASLEITVSDECSSLDRTDDPVLLMPESVALEAFESSFQAHLAYITY